MSSIDKRIVDMQFNNAQFNQGVDTTLKALSNLQNGLKLDGIADDIDNISSKFSVLGAVGFAAINKLVDWSMEAGSKLISNIYDPIIEGGKKRSLNLEHSYFQLQGLLAEEKNAAEQVQAIMANVNTAVDGTAYGLDAAAVAASQFAASGMRAGQDMENALRGISGVAAMAGSSYEDIADIFTTVSGQGKLMTMDMRRLESRGINVAATLGKEFGKTEAEIREMTTKGLISFEMFADGMNSAFGDHATKANETYAGSLSNVKAALARVGQQYFRGTDVAVSNGHLERQRKIFVALIPAINGFAGALKLVMDPFNEVKNAKNDKFVKMIESLGDAETITEKLSPTFDNIGQTIKAFYEITQSYLKPIKEAFRDVFPKDDNSPSLFLSVLEKITGAIRKVAEAMVLGTTGQNILYTGFKLLFQALKSGIGILKIVWEGIKLLGSGLVEVGKVIGALLQPIADWFSNLISGFTRSNKEGDGFLNKLSQLSNQGLAIFSLKMQEATEAVRRFSTDKIVPALDKLRNRFKPMTERLRSFNVSWDGVKNIFVRLGNAIQSVYQTVLPYLQKTWDFVKKVAVGIKDSLQALGIDGVLGILAGGGLIALIKVLLDMNKGFKGIMSSVTGVLDGLKTSLTRFGTDVPATKLTTIALSLVALAIALRLLSDIDIADIAKGLLALAGGLGIMLGALAIFSKTMGTFNKDLSLFKVGMAFVMLSIGLHIFARAMKTLSGVSWEDTAKGLITFIAALGILSVALRAVAVDNVLRGAFALAVLSTTLLLFAATLKVFSLISWATIGDGIAKLAAAIALMVTALWSMNKLTPSILKISAALVVMTFALNGFIALILLSSFIPFRVIAKGLLNIAAALAVMIAALKLLSYASKDVLAISAAMIPLAFSLTLIALAIRMLHKVPLWGLAKGLLALAGGMAILVVAMLQLGKLARVGGPKLLALSGAIVLLSSSLLVLALAMRIIAGISLIGAVKSIVTIVAVLGAIGLLLFHMDKIKGGIKGMLTSVLGLVGVIGSLVLLALALRLLGSIPTGHLIKALVALGVAMGLLVAVLYALAAVPWVVFVAVGAMMLAGAGSLLLVGMALHKLGSVNWDNIGDNLGKMFGAMAVLAGGALLNTFGLLGSASMLLGANALIVLAEAFKRWENISIPQNLEEGMNKVASGLLVFNKAILAAPAAFLSGNAIRNIAEGLKTLENVKVPENLGSILEDLASGLSAFTFGNLWSGLGAAMGGVALKGLAEALSAWKDVKIPSDLGISLERMADGLRAFTFGHLWGGLGALVSGMALKNLAQQVMAWKDVTVPSDLDTNLEKIANGIRAFGFGRLVEALSAMLTGNALIKLADAIKAWGSISVPSSIEADLKSLANGIRAFGFGRLVEALSAMLTGNALIRLAQSMQAWRGVDIPDTLEKDLKSLANGIRQFGMGDFIKAYNAITVGGAFVALARGMKVWSEVKIPRSVAQDMKMLGKAIRNFGFLDIFRSSGAGYSARAFTSLGKAISTWSDVNIPSNIDRDLKRLSKGLNEFGFLQTFTAMGASSIANSLGSLATGIKAWDGVSVPSNLGKDLKDVAEALRVFGIGDLFDALGAHFVSNSLVGLANGIKAWENITIPASISEDLQRLVEGIRQFSLGDIFDSTGASSAASALRELASAMIPWMVVRISSTIDVDLQRLATGIGYFSFGHWFDAVGASSTAGALTKLAGSVRAWTGISVSSTIDTDLRKLATGIGYFGLGNVLNALGGSSTSGALVQLAVGVQAWEGMNVPSTIDTDLQKLATGIGYFGFGDVLKALGGEATGGALLRLGIGVKAWAGVNVPSTIELDLQKLATGIGYFGFGDVLNALGGEATGGAMISLSNGVKAWVGVNVPSTIELDLQKLATGIGYFGFGDVLKALGGEATGGALIRLGIGVRTWSGVNVPPTIESDLQKLATGIGYFGFGDVLNALGGDATGGAMISLGNGVKAWETVRVPSTIDSDLQKLATGIGYFGLGNVLGALSSLGTGSSLESLADGARAWEGIQVPPNIETQLKAIANGVAAFTGIFGSGDMIDTIVDPLQELATAVSSWQSVTVPSTIESDLQAIANGVAAFDSIKKANSIEEVLPVVANIPPAIRGYSTLSIPNDIETQLTNISDAINALSGINIYEIQDLTEPLKNLASAIKQWNGVNISSSIVKDLYQLSNALEEFTSLNIPTELASNLDTLRNAVESFGSAVATSGSSVSSASKSISNGLSKITSAVEGVESKISKAGSGIEQGVSQINRNLSKIGSGTQGALGAFTSSVSATTTQVTASIKILSKNVTSEMSNLTNGIRAEGTSAASELTAMSTKMRLSMTTMLNTVKSITKQIIAAMLQMSVGIGQAVQTASRTINTAVNSIITGALASLNSARGRIYSASYSVGLSVGQGMAQGIYAGRSSAITAAASVAGSALAAAKRALDIHSPSRKMAQVGGFFTLGFAKGIIQNESKIEAATEAITDSAITTAVKMADELQELLDAGLISDPVITPVLDLDHIRDQASAIGGVLNPKRSLAMATLAGDDYNRNRELREMERALSDEEKEAPITFNQYNNSPKALSTADIWRQTRNQLAAARAGSRKPKGM